LVHCADNVGRDDTLELNISSRYIAALTTRQDVSIFESSSYIGQYTGLAPSSMTRGVPRIEDIIVRTNKAFGPLFCDIP
jgi:hypothetical protein